MAAAASAPQQRGKRHCYDRPRGKTGRNTSSVRPTGFGYERFGREMSGPEYAAIFEQKLEELGIKIYSSSMVTSITEDRFVTYQNQNGFFTIEAGAIILAMGCR